MTNYSTSRGGYWSNIYTWDPHGQPTSGDTASISGGTVVVDGDASANKTTLGASAGIVFEGSGSLRSNLNAMGSVTVEANANAYIGEILTSGVVTIGSKATLTIGSTFSSTSDINLTNGSVLNLAGGEQKTALQGHFSFHSSELILGRSTVFGGTYLLQQSTLALSDSALNAVKASAEGVVFTNRGTITGAGTMGAGTMSFVNGQDTTKGTIKATGEDNALVFDLGSGESFKNVNGLIEASGSAGLIVQAADPAGGGKLVNNSTMQAVNNSKIEISHVAVVNESTALGGKAVIEATDIGNVIFDAVDMKNTEGEILASGGGTIHLLDTEIEGGTLKLDGIRTGLVTTGKNVLKNVDFNSTGTLFVQAGSLLDVSGAGSSTIAAATIGGRLAFGHDVTLKGKGKLVLSGELVSSSTLTNVDEQITGTGTLQAANLVNQKGASISGSVDIDVGSTAAGSGKLTNAGMISGGRIEARDVDNTGTISNVVINVPHDSSSGSGVIENYGSIDAAVFGRSVISSDGIVQADGAGQVTSFAGTKLYGGTLSSSNGGVIAVEAATDVTVLDPDKIAAGTTIAISNGSSVELDGPGALGDVRISLDGGTETTTLNLVRSGVTLSDGSAITLSDSDNNRLLITRLTNASGTISGAGEITEAAPDVNSTLVNRSGSLIEAKGSNDLTIRIDRLVNDGVLEADDSTLTIYVNGSIAGSGQALVTNGGTIDMSDVRQYLGSFRYVGQGTILGPDLVPAGTISGFATGDSYVFGKTNVLADEFTTVWTENVTHTGGTLTVLAGVGEAYATLNFSGSYSSDDFSATQVRLQDGNHVALSFVGALRWDQAVNGNWQDVAKWAPTGAYAPGAADNALIAAVDTTDPATTYKVRVLQDTTVKSVATGSTATLEIQDSTFTTTTGTNTNVNAGLVRVVKGADFVTGGTFAQSSTGSILVAGAGSTIDIAEGATISGGDIYVGLDAALRTTGGTAMLSGVRVHNRNTIDVADRTRLVLADADIVGPTGVVNVEKGSTLALASGSRLHSAVALDGTLEIDASTVLKASITLDGSGQIVSGGTAAKLTSLATIDGGGRIGDAMLTVTNMSQITAAAGKTIDISTGDNTVANYGTMLAKAGATLNLGSDLKNLGSLLASGGTARFNDAVNNLGAMQVDGSGSLLDYRGDLVNSGAVSATGGGVIQLHKAVVQKAGDLLASDQGSKILLDSGASVTGGQIHLGYLAALQVFAGGQASLHNVTMTLGESSDVSVTNGSLVVTDSRIGADKSAELSAIGANAHIQLGNSVVDGGRIGIARTSMLVDGTVTLTGNTQTSLDNGSILGGGSAATLKNAGFISGSGTSRIAGGTVSLVNEGTITTAASSTASMSIDTGGNAIVNSGTIGASVAGSKMSIAGQVNNLKSGDILSGSGTVLIGSLNNIGDVKASGVGFIGITGAVINDGGLIQAASGGTIEAAATVANTSGTIRATGLNSTIGMTAVGLENDGTVEAKAGGAIDMLVEVNRGKMTATGEGSLLDITFTATGGGNKGWIVADEGGMVAVGGSAINAGGRLVAQGGGEVEVRGAVQGGLAVLSGDASVMDLQGSATEDTTTQVSFTDDGIAQLVLGHSSRFAGTVAGLGADDTIDVTDIGFVEGKSYYDEASDQLVIGDGAHTATIQLLGQYAASQFAFSSDGNGGTLVTAQTSPAHVADLGMVLAAHG